MHKFVFVDTNVFEHFPPLTDLDWLDLATASHVTLVIAPITIRELNKHKDVSPRARLRRRAGSALRQLSVWSEALPPAVIRQSVDLLFRSSDALIDFASFHLRSDIPDDELLAAAIEFAREAKLSSDSVLVATGDLGLQLKVRSQSAITVLRMPDSLRAPDEPDAEEKRVKELEERLKRISNVLPELSLTFLDGKTFERRTLGRGLAPIDQGEVEKALKIIRIEYPRLAPHPAPPPGWTFSKGRKEERDEYNSKILVFYSEYEQFLKRNIEVGNWQARTRSLCLMLKNNGGAPAQEVSVSLTFPSGLEVIADSNLKAIPKIPRPPDLPSEKNYRRDESVSFEEIVNEIPRNAQKTHNSTVTEIRNSRHGSEVEVSVERLKHTFSECLPVINLHFPVASEPQSFHFKYKIVASNIPAAQHGELNVKIALVD